MPYPQKVDVKRCVKRKPPHPCDPPEPCDPLDDNDDDCPSPFLCFEKLKNPETPDHATRCKEGNSIGVRTCTPVKEPHPCDPLPTCADLPKLKKTVCKEPPLCVERIKNPEIEKIRRVLCMTSKGKLTEKELKK